MLMKRFFVIIACLLTITIGLWISTQQVAEALHYQKQLGAPLFIWRETPIYTPKFLVWWYAYGKYLPQQFNEASNPTFLSLILGTIILGAGLAFKRKPKEHNYHGSARWADKNDLKKTGLLDNQGVVLGVTENGEYIRHNGSEHLMLMAPTRSGKGVGIIIPTLLTWPHSVLITDIKGENWGITAGYRRDKLGNKVLKFDPTACDGSSIRYNPLEEIRLRTVHEVQDIQNIADMLVDPQGTGEQDHWAKTAHALLVGVILHLRYILPNATMTDIAAFLSNPDQSFEDSLAEMLTTSHIKLSTHLFRDIYGVDTETHPVVAQAARELLNKSPNEMSGVVSTAISFLGLYRDPIVAANTACSEFEIADLMNFEAPVSLYLVVPPSDLNRTRPLIRMILSQILRRLTEKMEFKEGKAVTTYKHRLLMLIDEFPALGRLDPFESSLAFIAGYGLKAFLIIQSLNQLNKIYTPDNSIIDNCHVRVVYAPNDEKTPEFISKLLGSKTEEIKTTNYQGSRFSLWLSGVNTSIQYAERPLLTPGEITQFPQDEEIIFLAGCPPIRAKKIRYFEDENFTVRLQGAPEKSEVIRKINLDRKKVASQVVLKEQEKKKATSNEIQYDHLFGLDDDDDDLMDFD